MTEIFRFRQKLARNLPNQFVYDDRVGKMKHPELVNLINAKDDTFLKRSIKCVFIISLTFAKLIYVMALSWSYLSIADCHLEIA